MSTRSKSVVMDALRKTIEAVASEEGALAEILYNASTMRFTVTLRSGPFGEQRRADVGIPDELVRAGSYEKIVKMVRKAARNVARREPPRELFMDKVLSRENQAFFAFDRSLKNYYDEIVDDYLERGARNLPPPKEYQGTWADDSKAMMEYTVKMAPYAPGTFSNVPLKPEKSKPKPPEISDRFTEIGKDLLDEDE